MLMRKINAGLSLLTTLLLLNHTISNAVWMVSLGNIQKSDSFILSWVLYGVMMIHAVISIGLAISAHSKAEKRKCKAYPKLNISTVDQRVSGMLLIVFTALHVAGAAGFMHPPKLVHAIMPPCFFTIALAHVAVSTHKAFITLGIGNARFIKTLSIATKIFCVVALIVVLIGFYLYKV